MKVILNNKHGIITDADFWKTDLALNLVIHTASRYRKPDCFHATNGELKFIFYKDPDNSDKDIHDSVMLLSENKQEELMLMKQEFCQQGKQQLWYIIVQNRVWNNKEIL